MVQDPARFRLVTAFVLACVGATLVPASARAQARSALWTAIGPGPGDIRDVIADPRDYRTVYVVSRSGVYKSTDAGETWQLLPVKAGSSSEGARGSLGVAYSNPQRLYFGGAKRSDDGGATWTTLPGGVGSPVAVDPRDPQIVYGGGSGPSLRRSTDGGLTSVSIPIVDPLSLEPGVISSYLWLQRLVIDPVDPAVLFAVGLLGIQTRGCEFVCSSEQSAFYRSPDRGTSWQRVDVSETPLANAAVVYLGDVWVRAPETPFSPAGPWTLSLRMSSAPPVALPAVPFGAVAPLPAATFAVTVGPTILYAASQCDRQDPAVCTGLSKSVDGGMTWTAVHGIHNPQFNTFASNSWRGNSVAMAAADPRQIHAHTRSVPPPPPNYATSNGGATWRSTVPLSAPTRQLFVDPVVPGTLYASAWGGLDATLQKSLDSGLTWSPIDIGELPASCRSGTAGERYLLAHPRRSGVLYTWCALGIYRTEDAGVHWSLWANFGALVGQDVPNATSPPTWRPAGLFIDPTRPSNIYASIEWSVDTTTMQVQGTALLRSTDNGATFTRLAPPTTSQIDRVQEMTFEPARAGVIYVIVGTFTNPGHSVYQSVDGGVSWLRLDTPVPVPRYMDIEVDPVTSDVYVADFERGVFWLDRGAPTWTPLGLNAVDALLAPTATSGVHVITRNDGIWKLPAACATTTFSFTALAGGQGGRRSVRVETSTPGCLWKATSSLPWITVVGSSLRAGSGTLTYEVAANTSAATRIGSLTVNGAALNVTQSANDTSEQGLDFNGDGRADLFAFDRTSGEWTVYLSDGLGGFTVGSRGGWLPTWTILPADFNGDGLSDFLLYHPVNGLWYRAISNGLGGFTYSNGGWRPQLTPYVVHLDRDALSDVLLYDAQTGEFWTAHSVDGGARFEYTAGGWSPGWKITPLAQSDGSDDLLLYNESSGLFYTASNLGSHAHPALSASYQGGGWRGGWSRIERDGNVLLYDERTGDTFQTLYTQAAHPFHYWDHVRWPAGLRVLAARGYRSAELPEYVLYAPSSGLYYVAAGLPSEAFVYYVGQWPANRETIVADFTGDGRDDVLLYDAATGAYTLATNRGPGEDMNWAGFEERTGTLGAGLELIVSSGRHE
jgi:hypothetical protein